MTITISGTDGISPLKASGQTQTTTGSAAAPAISSSSDTDSGLFFGTNEVNISTGGTQRAAVDSSGRLLVGTTSPALTTSGNNLQSVHADGSSLALGRDDTSVTNGNLIGAVRFVANDPSGYNQVAKIVCDADGAHAADDYPTRLEFYVTRDGESTETERLRIANNGEQRHFGTLATNINIANTASAGNTYEFLYCQHSSTGLANGTNSFRVATDGDVFNTNNSYGSLSDQRLKENIVDATSQWDDIKGLQVRKYNFRENTGHETHTQIGLIAQEVESVSPGLVETSAVREGETVQDADGNQLESIKSINYSVLYMKAVKALQEAQTRIETLESQHADLLARVTALEAA